MNRVETIQVITLLAGNYDSISKKDKAQKDLMITTWQECLGDLDYKLILQAVKKAIIESSYPPTIHEVRKNAVEMINPIKQRTGIEAWNEAHSMICKGLYMTEEEFNRASDEVKHFFGSVRQVAELARADMDTVNTVVKGQFLKQYEVIVQRDREQRMLPVQMQDFVRTLTEKISVKQIGE